MLRDIECPYLGAVETCGREANGNAGKRGKGGAVAPPPEQGALQSRTGECSAPAHAHRAEVVSLHAPRRRQHDPEARISPAKRDVARNWSKRSTRRRPPSLEQIEQRIEVASLVEREAFFDALCALVRTAGKDAQTLSRAKNLLCRLAAIDLCFDDRVGVALVDFVHDHS